MPQYDVMVDCNVKRNYPYHGSIEGLRFNHPLKRGDTVSVRDQGQRIDLGRVVDVIPYRSGAKEGLLHVVNDGINPEIMKYIKRQNGASRLH